MEIEQEVVVDQGSNQSNPVLNPEPASSAETDEISTETVEEAVKKPVEAELPKGVQKRIDRAVRQKYEAEARSKMLEERLSAIESRQAPVQRAIEPTEPTIDKFDNFDDYVAAKAEFIAERKINQTLSAREERQRADNEAAERSKTADSWTKKVEQATADMPDFEDVIASSDVPMTQPMQQAIMESDIGPKLAYHLANHPEEAIQIAKMSHISAVKALGRLEERLSVAKSVAKPTSTSAPITPVGTRATLTKSLEDASYDDFVKMRRKQVSSRI